MLTHQFTFKGMDSTDSVRNYAQDRATKLEKFFQSEVIVKWTFEYTARHKMYEVHCHLVSDQFNDTVAVETHDIHESIDQCVEKLHHQVEKQHDKMVAASHGKT